MTPITLPLQRAGLLFILAVVLPGCNSTDKNSSRSDTTTQETLNPMSVPDGFDYQMNQDLTVRIQVLDHNGAPADRVGVQISEANNFTLASDDAAVPTAAPLPNLISRGQTDPQGYFEQTVRLPGHARQVVVQVSQLGITNRAVLDINGSTLFHEFN